MPKIVEALLSKVGIPSEDISKVLSVPEAEQEQFDVSPYVDKIKTNYQTQLQNDPHFFNDLTLEKLPDTVKKKVESGQYGRATNVAKEKIAKALGFTSEEIKDLEADEYKALDFYIPAILEKWTKNKSGDKQTQEQLIQARKKLEEYDGYEDKIKTKYEAETNQRVNSIIFNSAVVGELSTIPNLKISAADIAKTAHDILQSKYSFERVGDYGIELRQKQNPQMKVLKGNTSQELTLKEALTEIAVERGWVDKEKTPEGPVKGKIEVKPDGKGSLTMVAPHLQKKIGDKINAEA